MAHNSHDPYNAPPLRGLGPVQATLRVFVALQCWGFAAANLHFGARSAFARLLEKEFYWAAKSTAAIDQAAAIVLVGCGMMCLLRPAWPVLLALSGAQAAYAISKAWVSDSSPPAVMLASHLAFVLSPLILGCADFWPGKRKFSLGFWIAVAILMRVAVSVSFIGSGLLGLMESQSGGDLVRVATGAIEKLTRHVPSSLEARTTLAIASAIQLGVGLALVLKRSREAAALATVVGIFLAGCYSMGLGMAGYPRTLTHLIQGGLAAALFLFWMRATHEGELRYVPDLPVVRSKGVNGH